MKLNENFSELNLNWLLYVIGSFPNNDVHNPTTKRIENKGVVTKNQNDDSKDKHIAKIVFFYKDGTFKTYHED